MILDAAIYITDDGAVNTGITGALISPFSVVPCTDKGGTVAGLAGVRFGMCRFVLGLNARFVY